MDPHEKWLRDHGMGPALDKLPKVPKEICTEHSNPDKGTCDKFCPYYNQCLPFFEELAKQLEKGLSKE